jgi:hypothetical protein
MSLDRRTFLSRIGAGASLLLAAPLSGARVSAVGLPPTI